MSIFKKILGIFGEFLETFVIAGALFALIYYFLLRPFIVVGHSMDPTYADGENVLTNLITLRFSPLKKGDVIVFQALPPNEEKDFIKRVIGLPGDRVMIKDGSVYLNGEKLGESSYLPVGLETYGGQTFSTGRELTVPKDSYFVLGDNRGNSSDSRDWGFIGKDHIIGKSFLVYWPPARFRLIKDPIYSN